MDKELLSLKEKMAIISAENIIKRINNSYFLLTGIYLERDYILKNYELEAKRFHIQITKEDKKTLTKLLIIHQTLLTDFHIKRLLQEKTALDSSNAVINVDFVTKKIIKY